MDPRDMLEVSVQAKELIAVYGVLIVTLGLGFLLGIYISTVRT